MPLYEYQCDACERRFERIQKFSDPLVDTCPTCGGHVRKLLSSPAFQFKGTGFYITDYPKKSADGGKGDGQKSDSTSSDSKSSDSKSSDSKSSESSSGTSDSSASSASTATKAESKSERSGSKSESK
jgi:putative FmdB family regulatory protein